MTLEPATLAMRGARGPLLVAPRSRSLWRASGDTLAIVSRRQMMPSAARHHASMKLSMRPRP
jgi:hypothetical protein